MNCTTAITAQHYERRKYKPALEYFLKHREFDEKHSFDIDKFSEDVKAKNLERTTEDEMFDELVATYTLITNKREEELVMKKYNVVVS